MANLALQIFTKNPPSDPSPAHKYKVGSSVRSASRTSFLCFLMLSFFSRSARNADSVVFRTGRHSARSAASSSVRARLLDGPFWRSACTHAACAGTRHSTTSCAESATAPCAIPCCCKHRQLKVWLLTFKHNIKKLKEDPKLLGGYELASGFISASSKQLGFRFAVRGWLPAALRATLLTLTSYPCASAMA